MPLIKIADFNPNYRQDAFDGEDVKGLDVYGGKTAEKIGTIHDVLVDEQGRFRYFVIDTGFWILVSRFCFQLVVVVLMLPRDASMPQELLRKNKPKNYRNTRKV
jgi:hypothetical protein